MTHTSSAHTYPPPVLSPSFHFSCYTNVHTQNKYPHTHMHQSFYLQIKNTQRLWQQLIHILYIHVISLSNVSAHTPLAVLCHRKHMHTQTHTLTYRSIYSGQLLSQSVGSLVRGNNSGADGKASECLAAAAESYPSMAPAASSPPHIFTHTLCHLFS